MLNSTSFVSVVKKNNSQEMERPPRSLFTMESTVSWKTNRTGVFTVVMKAT